MNFRAMQRFYSSGVKRQTAGIIVIGNEILNSRVSDLNSHYICKLLYQCGVAVKKISVIDDNIDSIANEVRYYSDNFDHVITSGGIGPTHDDVTFEGLAKAFDEKLKHNAQLVDIIQNKFQVTDRASPDFKMALIPRNSQLHFGTNERTGERLNYPCVQIKNVFVFPGSPHFLRGSFGSLCKKLFGACNSFQTMELYLDASEASFADALTAVSKEFPSVKFGSYPQNNRSCYKALVTLESDDTVEMARAKTRLENLIPSRIVLNPDEIPWRVIMAKYQNFGHDCKNYHLYHNTMCELRRLYIKPERVIIYMDGEPESLTLLQLAHIVTSCNVANNSKLKIMYLKSNQLMSRKIDDLVQRFKAQVIAVEEPTIQAALRSLESDSDIDYILLSSFSDTAAIFNGKVHCPLKHWTADDARQFIQTF